MLETELSPYLSGENPDMSTLAFTLTEEAYNRPEMVKVLVDKQGYALYFSRRPIPYFKPEHHLAEFPVYHHMGLYAFRADFLQVYCKLAQTPLEKAEALEQLRALENGYRIKVCLTNGRTLEINTPEDYERAQQFTPPPVD